MSVIQNLAQYLLLFETRRIAMSFMWLVSSLSIAVGGLIFGNVERASAQGSCGLVITEIMFEPTNASSPEWIELFNPTSAAVSISGFTVEDNNGIPSSAIGTITIPAGESAILFDSTDGTPSGYSTTDFSTEWGSSSDVVLVPLIYDNVFQLNLDLGGDTVVVKDDNGDVCTEATYGGFGADATGNSIYLVSQYEDNSGTPEPTLQDDSDAANWQLSADCQGTHVFTSFSATTGDIGSPNGTVPSSCYPTITTSSPFIGDFEIPLDLNEILVKFSEPIGIQDDANAISLACGSETPSFSISPSLPILPSSNVTEVTITLNEDLTTSTNVTLCTLSFNQGFLIDVNGIPGDLEVTFSTVGATLIELASFEARRGVDGKTALTWITAAEIDNAGFNLYRSNSSVGPWTQVNTALIPAQGNPFEDTSYSFTDNTSGAFYLLEDVDIKGTLTQHGPFGENESFNVNDVAILPSLYLPLFR